jgi:hypothetical protein
MITRFGLFMERFWMVVSILAVMPAAVVTCRQGWEAGRDFWLLASLCFAMWMFRIFTRKRMQVWEHRKKEHGR